MMHMTFYWGTKLTLLFDSWKTDSWLSYLLTLLACFFAASFYQYMEDRRLRFKSLASAKPGAPSISGNEAAPLLIKRGGVNAPKYATAVFFGINSAIGYLLMLAIMSYNGGVFLAVVLGLTIGYLFFRSGDEEIVVVDNPCACA